MSEILNLFSNSILIEFLIFISRNLFTRTAVTETQSGKKIYSYLDKKLQIIYFYVFIQSMIHYVNNHQQCWIIINDGLSAMMDYHQWWIILNDGLSAMMDYHQWWIIISDGLSAMMDYRQLRIINSFGRWNRTSSFSNNLWHIQLLARIVIVVSQSYRPSRWPFTLTISRWPFVRAVVTKLQRIWRATAMGHLETVGASGHIDSRNAFRLHEFYLIIRLNDIWARKIHF